MSDSNSTRDISEGYSNPSSRRKSSKSTQRDGRSKETAYDYRVDGPMSDEPPIYDHSKVGHPQNTSRPLAPPNSRSSNDVGHYLPAHQEQFNPYSVAPLAAHPQGGSQSALYAINSDTGNTTTTTAMESFNKTRTAVSQGSLYNGAVSTTSTVVNVFNFHSAKAAPNYPQNRMPLQPAEGHPPQSYHSHTDHSAPTMRPSISDPYNQRGDARNQHLPSKDMQPRPVNQPKPPYPYNHEKVPETIHSRNNEERLEQDRNPRSDPSGRYKDINSSRSPQYLPNLDQRNASIATEFTPERETSKGGWANKSRDLATQPQPRPREDKRQPETGIQGWSGEDEEPSREKTPKAYSSIPQPPRMSTLPPQTSWPSKDVEPIYGSPKSYSKTSSSESVLTARQGNLGRQWSKDQDNDPERDSDSRNYGSTSLNAHASGDPSTTLKGSSSSSLPTSSLLPPQRRQNSQSGRLTNQDIQDTSPYSIHHGPPRDPRDQRRSGDLHNDDGYDSLERPPRDVSHPAQRTHGGTWHNITPDGFQPQTSPRNQPRQEDTTNPSWTGPSSQISSGRNFPTSYSSSNQMNEGRPVLDQPTTHVGPYSTGFQYPPNQTTPGSWTSPYGPPSSSASGSMFPSAASYSQLPAGQPSLYQNDLSQRMAQTSLSNAPRGPLLPIPEVQQQSSYAISIAPSHVSRTSISTIPGKCMSFGNPRLRPLQQKAENEGRRRRKHIDAESHISSYMASDIVDQDTTPLWSPSPKLFGSDRQRRGIEVGDLGFMDESGEFTSIFNIFYSHEANASRGANPPNYHHFQPLQADRHESVKKVDIQKRHVYWSENIRRHDGPPGHFLFSIKKRAGRRGAIIVLPHGGLTSTLRGKFFQLPNVKEYFRENAASWYQHARTRPDTQNLSNGSLLFIQGTHVARTWGIATFFSKDDVKESQRISFLPTDSNPYEYQWDWYSEKWRFRTGPSVEELSGLYDGQPPPKNQCIGIIASSVFLDDNTWQAYFSGTNDRNSVSQATRGIYNPFNRWLSRTKSSSSLNSSIRVDRPYTGRRYLDSIRENQRGEHYGNDFELFSLEG